MATAVALNICSLAAIIVAFLIMSVFVGTILCQYALSNHPLIKPAKRASLLSTRFRSLCSEVLDCLQFQTSRPQSNLWQQRGYLEKLPQRPGSRPQTSTSGRQQQLTQCGPESTYQALSQLIKDFSASNGESTYLGRSTFEHTNTSLYSRQRTFGQTWYRGEICHVHPSDSSLRLTLHPADAKTVIENGWGELGWLQWQPLSLRLSRDSVYLMLYAPRNQEELQVAREVIRAASWWVGGIDSKIARESWS